MISTRINALVKLGSVMQAIGESRTWEGYSLGITEEEYNELDLWVQKAKVFNGWFEEKEVRRSFAAWGVTLTEENINQWIANYSLDQGKEKTVAIIMAGNIPMVGLHDFICCYTAGVNTLIKLSSDDDRLIPAIINVLKCFDEHVNETVSIVATKLEGFDAVIATGSNNTARHFEQYFGKYPNIIRKNRTSVAVITGDEIEEELKPLADDIFAYYGLGCRNVTKLYLPRYYNLDKIFGALFHYKDVTDNKKYGNNYDYHKAIFLMERYNVMENGFLLMKEDQALVSPIGTLYYEYYDNLKEVEEILHARSEEIQCVIGQNNIPFGQAQLPSLSDYADGVDTIEFILSL